MDTDTKQVNRSKWLVLCLALASAILTFRISTFVISLAFLILQRFPFRVIAFIHLWDYVIVPLLSICAAVLASRWQERILETKSTRANFTVFIVVTLLAFCPVYPQVVSARPVMCSPLRIAINRNYSVKTVELLVDRYPRLINGRNVAWDNYCPLVEAAYSGKTNVVELLVRKGANVDYAIERLMELDAQEPIALVLKFCKERTNTVKATGKVSSLVSEPQPPCETKVNLTTLKLTTNALGNVQPPLRLDNTPPPSPPR